MTRTSQCVQLQWCSSFLLGNKRFLCARASCTTIPRIEIREPHKKPTQDKPELSHIFSMFFPTVVKVWLVEWYKLLSTIGSIHILYVWPLWLRHFGHLISSLHWPGCFGGSFTFLILAVSEVLDRILHITLPSAYLWKTFASLYILK